MGEYSIDELIDLIHSEFFPWAKSALRKESISKERAGRLESLCDSLAFDLAAYDECEIVHLMRRFQHHLEMAQYNRDPVNGAWAQCHVGELWSIWHDLRPRLEAFVDNLPYQISPELLKRDEDESSRELSPIPPYQDSSLPPYQIPEELLAEWFPELVDGDEDESSSEDSTIPPKSSKRRCMGVEEANRKAMELAKSMGEEFFLLSERKQAKRIGCSWQTWSHTEFYRTAKSKRSPQQAKDKTAARKVVRLTGNLEGAIGEGNRNEVLEKLIAEQEADCEPSPLEDDPPGQPRRVRCYKRS